MGCNFSSSAAPPNGRAGGGGGGGGANSGTGRPSGGGAPPLGQGNPHNRRVKAVAPWTWEAGAVVTHTELSMKRATFWEAQTSGRRLIWENLKVVSEAMLQGNTDLANTLLDAADIRVPNGDLSVCYDSLGQLYQVPRYIYSTPTNAVTDEEAAALATKTRKEHVGPVADVPLVLRVSPSGTNHEQDVRLSVKSDTTVGELKGALHAHLGSGAADQAADASNSQPNRWTGKGLPPHRQRIMYRGKELKDGVFMQEAGVSPGAIVQVFVRPEGKG